MKLIYSCKHYRDEIGRNVNIPPNGLQVWVPLILDPETLRTQWGGLQTVLDKKWNLFLFPLWWLLDFFREKFEDSRRFSKKPEMGNNPEKSKCLSLFSCHHQSVLKTNPYAPLKIHKSHYPHPTKIMSGWIVFFLVQLSLFVRL